MAYTFARVSAVVGLSVGDYRIEGKRARLRLMEKGNKEKLVWLHREAEEFLDAYIKGCRDLRAGDSCLPVARQSTQADWRSNHQARHAARGKGALREFRAVGGILQSHVSRDWNHGLSP
jgi:site-specific recombinase XerD